MVSMVWRELVIAHVKVPPFHSSGKAGVNQRNTHLSSGTVTICMKVCSLFTVFWLVVGLVSEYHGSLPGV